MAGVVPKRSASGRKQWTLHDGPTGSLKRLRNQLASDGCPESQVVLAKQLLEQSEVESESKENARLGVYWLIKASQQGNLEATELLTKCLETGKGISELNYLDVKSCITMSQDEKLARKAARKLFSNLSNGGEFITSNQLEKRILTVDREIEYSKEKLGYEENDEINANGELVNKYDSQSDSDSEDIDWSQRSDSSSTNEKLTEDDLVTAATNYSHGQLPNVNNILCLNDINLKSLDNIILIHRSILHPWLAVKILYYKLLRFLSNNNLLKLLVRSEFQFLIFIFIYLFINLNIYYLIPILTYLITFILMIVMTLRMLENKRELKNFRLWSSLFLCYSNGDLNSRQIEYQYIRNNLKPYGNFFLLLLMNLLIYPIIIIDNEWLPNSELTIISFCLTFITLFGFMKKRHSKIIYDYLILFSFGINVLARYPYEIDPVVIQGWRFLDLKVPTFLSYVIGNGIEFCINFRYLFYILILLIFIKIASKNQWKNVYETLIPHCVTLSWLQICILNSKGATMFGLLRGILALVGFVLFLPLAGLTSIILPAIALTKWLIKSDTIYTICIFIILFVIILGVCWIFAQTRYKKLTAFIQLISTFIAILILLNTMNYNSNNNNFIDDDKSKLLTVPQYLSWEIFQRFCHQPIWQEENIAIAQMKCSKLDNTYIHWDGYITDIKIRKITNVWQNLMNKLPSFLRDYFSCLYGDKIINECINLPNLIREECTTFYSAIKSQNLCTLDKYNIYTFEITIRMLSGIWSKSPEVTLIINNYFKNFTLNLKPNDHIWFKGKLFNNDIIGSDGILGGFKPHVNLEEIGCFACTNNKLSKLKLEKRNQFDVTNVGSLLFKFIKFIFNFILIPVVIFE